MPRKFVSNLSLLLLLISCFAIKPVTANGASETDLFTSDQALHFVAATAMTVGLGLLMEDAWETKADAIWRAAAATFVIFTIKEVFIDDTFSVGDEVFNLAGATTGAFILYEIQF